MMERKDYKLTDHELDNFNRLRPNQGEAVDFWTVVALVRGLDYKSIIGNVVDHRSFTALPLGHDKHWCYPYPKKVKPISNELKRKLT